MTAVPTERRPRPPGIFLTNALTLAGGLVLFFTFPVRGGTDTAALVRNIVVSAAGVGVVAWIVVRQARGAGRRELGPLQLVMLAEIVACVFAMTYYSMAVRAPGEFHGIHTRLDALYFTLTTMTTVGFGDIHATAQLSRAVVCVNLAFNLVFLGILARLLRRRLGSPEEH